MLKIGILVYSYLSLYNRLILMYPGPMLNAILSVTRIIPVYPEIFVRWRYVSRIYGSLKSWSAVNENNFLFLESVYALNISD